MARDTGEIIGNTGSHTPGTLLQVDGQDSLSLPQTNVITEGEILRDGQDLILHDESGQDIVIEGYFSANPPPMLIMDSGASLSPELVNSFVKNASPVRYSQAESMNDMSPVGLVEELSGQAHVIHPDGSEELLMPGSPIYQNDVIETTDAGAVKITFIDESSFAISENARLAIDEYVYDPATDSGTSDFSLLRGLFVYTSGLIGQEDPDDVQIETPIGSIGIRGTIIAGNIQPDGTSEITVIEGAIVVHNDQGSVTLAEQFETVTVTDGGQTYDFNGVSDEGHIADTYATLNDVSPELFLRFSNSYSQDNTGDSGSTESFSNTVPSGETSTQTNDSTADAPVHTDTLQNTQDPSLNFNGEDTTFSTQDGEALPLQQPIQQQTTTTGTVDGTNSTSTATAPQTTTTSTTTADGSAQPILPLALDFSDLSVPETVIAGNVIGHVRTTVDFPSVQFAVSNIPTDGSSNPLFTVTQTTPNTLELRLTNAGEAAFDAGDTFSFTVRASLPDGRSVLDTGTVFVGAPAPNLLVLNNLSAADGFVIAGTSSSGERLGSDIAAWGDGDLLVANNLATGGQVFSIDGSAQTITSSGGIPGTPSSGATIAAAGDFDGDGTLDYIVGAPESNTPAANGGGATVTSTSSPSFSGQNAGDALGHDVTAIGDINNDGYTDILIGAPGTDAGSTDSGAGYVVFGTPSALTSIDVSDSGPVNGISDFQDNGQGFTIEGISAGDLLGTNVGHAGDFNNDGYSDLIISEPGQGRVHVGFMYDGATDLTLGSGTLQVNNIAVDPSDKTIPVMNVGDINGDGISDIAIGANGYDGNGDSHMEGAIYFLYGKSSYSGGNTIDATNLSGGEGFSLTLSNSTSTIETMSAAGDFNGDGNADTAVAIRNGGHADIYVVYGQDGTSGDLTDTMLNDPSNAFHMVYDLSHLANPTTDQFEFVLSSAGDTNGDGFDDLAIGTPDANNGDGAVSIVYGGNDAAIGSDGNAVHIAGQTTALNGVIANANSQHLVGNSANNILQDNGFADVSMRGGDGNDLFQTYGNHGNIDGGSGFDKLELLGAGKSLDYSNLGSDSLSYIEQIGMGGNGQSITLGINDIFQLMQQSADHRLLIAETGSAGDTTSLTIDDFSSGSGTFASQASSLGFSNAGTTTEGGITYDVYTAVGGTQQLLIDQNIDAVNVA